MGACGRDCGFFFQTSNEPTNNSVQMGGWASWRTRGTVVSCLLAKFPILFQRISEESGDQSESSSSENESKTETKTNTLTVPTRKKSARGSPRTGGSEY